MPEKIGQDIALGKQTTLGIDVIKREEKATTKVRNDYWITIPSSIRWRLAEGKIELEINGKTFEAKMDKYGGVYLSKEIRDFVNINPGTEIEITPLSPTKIAITPVAPSAPTVAPAQPPAPTATAEETAQKRMKDIDWSKVEMVSVPEAKHLPMLIEDYYSYDRDLKQPDKPTVFMTGPPGVGKSVSVYEAAQSLAEKTGRKFILYSDEKAPELLKDPSKYDEYFLFVDLRLTEVEPQDLMGIPSRKVIGGREVMDYSPPLWAVCLSKMPGILFLDELTNVQRDDVISSAYKIALEKRVGFTNFHPETMVVAAGNPPEVSAIARELPAPLVSRMLKIEVSAPTVEAWADWMNKKYGDAWDRRVLAYLARREFREDFLKPPKEGLTLENFPTPRSWTKVAVMLPHIKPENAEVLLKGYLGEATASKFLAFIKTKPPEVEELLKNPQQWNSLSLDTKWLALVGLSAKLKEDIDKENVQRMDAYMDLIDVIDKDSAEYVAGLCAMVGREDLQKMIILVLKAKGTQGINRLTKSFSRHTEAKKIVEEMTKR